MFIIKALLPRLHAVSFASCQVTDGANSFSGSYGDFTLYGLNSRCVIIDESNSNFRGRCVRMKCNDWNPSTKKFGSVTLQMKDGNSVTCSQGEGNTRKTLVGNFGVECPVVDIVCDSEKPFDCLWGHHVNGKCVCKAGEPSCTNLPRLSLQQPSEHKLTGYKGTTCDTRDTGNLISWKAFTGTTTTTTTPPHSKICCYLTIQDAMYKEYLFSSLASVTGYRMYES